MNEEENYVMGTQKEPLPSNNIQSPADKQGRWAGIRQSVEGEQGIDWGHADPATLSSVIYAVTRTGAMISFAATRSGRAVRMTVLDGGDRPVWYANNEAELADALRDVLRRLSSF